MSLHDAVIGMAALVFYLADEANSRSSKPSLPRMAIASIILIALPALLNRFTPAVQPETSVALYALVPLCVVVATAGEESSRVSTMPALAGLAGALLLLSWRMPSTYRDTIGFAAVLLAVLLTAAGSVWMHTLIHRKNLGCALLIAAWTNVVIFGAVGLSRGDRFDGWPGVKVELLRALMIDLPQVFLLIWLVRDVAPQKFATRFFLVPLVTVVEGWTILHGPIGPRMGVGILLLLWGAAAILFSKPMGEVRLNLS